MSGIRSILLSVCTLALAAAATGCATISMAAGSGVNSERLTGPPAAPPPVTPPPSTPGAPATWTTTVANESGEDLAGPCHYSLYLGNPSATLRGVLVIYDRADSIDLFYDADVRSLAEALHFGLLFPEQCNAASFADLQPNAFAGPGRALFAALDQFATQTSHAELAKSDVTLFGFSAAGVLAATTANYKPSRVIGVIDYAGGSADQAMDFVNPAQGVLEVPFLVLSNSRDPEAGTSRDQVFFDAGWKEGAPWGRGVQPEVGHCCATSTKPLILPWIAAIKRLRLGSANQLANVSPAMGVFTTYTCTPNGIWDETGYQDCTFSAAAVIAAGSSTAGAQGWLPDTASGAAWLKWVGQ
jgi:hypothetical protein